jgi:hypothetical protein
MRESSVHARGAYALRHASRCTTSRFPRSPVLKKRSVAATSHLKASAPKLKHGAMAVRHWMILQGEIAFGQIGSGDTLCLLASADVRQRLLPKNSPKRLK